MTTPRGSQAVLIDSAVAICAMGDPGPQRDACQRFLDDLWNGSGRAYASVEMIQETVHHRLRRLQNRAAAVADVRELIPSVILLNFDREVLDLALDLIERTDVRGRDAVHAATALAYGIETIVSPDPAFDAVPGIRRLDPLA